MVEEDLDQIDRFYLIDYFISLDLSGLVCNEDLRLEIPIKDMLCFVFHLTLFYIKIATVDMSEVSNLKLFKLELNNSIYAIFEHI